MTLSGERERERVGNGESYEYYFGFICFSFCGSSVDDDKVN